MLRVHHRHDDLVERVKSGCSVERGSDENSGALQCAMTLNIRKKISF